MPNLSYVDFIPRLIEERNCFSTLSLSSGVPGPTFEAYDSIVDRANGWLRKNPASKVVSCETIAVEGMYDMENDYLTSEERDERSFPAFLLVLRIWVTSQPVADDDRGSGSRFCQISYKNVLPARLESNPDAIGPKYEHLSEAISSFNKRLSDGEDSIPGQIVSMETCTCRFTTRNCSVDPTKTFWMTGKKQDVHYYNYFRIYYIAGPSSVCEFGFQDFCPQYTGNPRKTVKSENFVHLTRRAEQWIQNNQASRSLKMLNVQTLNHNMLFKSVRDSIGTEKKVLDNPHCVHNHGHVVYHTKVLRLYHVKRGPLDGSPLKQPHILHKTFHVPNAILTHGLRINGYHDQLLPTDHQDETMSRIRRWIVMKGVKVTGVETVKLLTGHGRDMVSAEDTHFESQGPKTCRVVYAVRLYVTDESGSLSKKDLNPDPKNVKLSEHHCTIL